MAQKVLITAAASGIGREIARAFSSIGATVFITDINVQALDAAQKEMPGLLIKMCDNSKRSDIEATVPAAVEALGGLDVLINNAGISGPTAPVEQIDPDQWEAVMAVDLTGNFKLHDWRFRSSKSLPLEVSSSCPHLADASVIRIAAPTVSPKRA